MENYEQFEQLLQQHSFKELSEEQRLFVKDYINSEEDYETFRNATLKLNEYFKKKETQFHSSQILKKIKRTWQTTSSRQNILGAMPLSLCMPLYY